MPIESGADRADRQLGWMMSVGGCLQIAMYLPNAWSFFEQTEPLWIVVANLVPGLIILGALTGRFLGIRYLRCLWATTICCALLLLILFSPELTPVGGFPLVWVVDPVWISYSVLLLKPWQSISLAIFSGLTPALGWLVRGQDVPIEVLTQTPVHIANLGFSAIFIGVRNQLTRQRAVEEKAKEEQERATRAKVASEQQTEFALVIHDEVLSVLNAAASFRGTPPTLMRRSAEQVVELLMEAQPSAPQGWLTAQETLSRTLEVISQYAPQAEHEVTGAAGEFPESVVLAMHSALGEALRNSVRHADAEGLRVEIRLEPGCFTLVVADAGIGFEPAKVAPHRLGIKRSIVHRLSMLPGGFAQVRSRPGEGTIVKLRWQP